MRRDRIRRCLAWGVVATLLLPIVLVAVLGLGGLLAALGDAPGATACGRIGMGIGIVWLTAVVATTAVNAVALLDIDHRSRGDRRPGRRRRRRGLRGEVPPVGLGDAVSDRPS